MAAATGTGDGADHRGAGAAADGRAGGRGDRHHALARTTTPGPAPDSPVVVLLHAFPLDRTLWDDVVPLLAARARVVAVDLPGLGGSAVPDEEPDLDVAVRGLLAALDLEGVGTAVVVGLSTGGYVATRLVGLAPERVSGLALLGTSTHVGPPDDPDERRATAEQVLGAEGLDAVTGSVDEGLSERARRDRPDLVARVRSSIAAQRPAGVAWVARALAARHDTTAGLAAFPGPVLLLFGAEDAATPPGQRAAELRETRPDAELVVVPGSGHLTALEAPDVVAAAVLRLVDAAAPAL